MDDLLTLILVLGASALAIGLVVILNVILGGWTPSRLHNAEEAMQAMAGGVFGFAASEPVGLDKSGRAALAREAGGGRLGPACALGDRIAVRALNPGDLRQADREGDRLILILDDYTLPKAELVFLDDAEAVRWQKIARSFVRQAPEAVQPSPNHA